MIWNIVAQVLLALQTCHNRSEGKILHRDLKPGNIFLDADNNVKLGDFGLSHVMGDESVFAQTHVGTPYYMSPEQINEQKYNEKLDIWSLGCIIYEISLTQSSICGYHSLLASLENQRRENQTVLSQTNQRRLTFTYE